MSARLAENFDPNTTKLTWKFPTVEPMNVYFSLPEDIEPTLTSPVPISHFADMPQSDKSNVVVGLSHSIDLVEMFGTSTLPDLPSPANCTYSLEQLVAICVDAGIVPCGTKEQIICAICKILNDRGSSSSSSSGSGSGSGSGTNNVM